MLIDRQSTLRVLLRAITIIEPLIAQGKTNKHNLLGRRWKRMLSHFEESITCFLVLANHTKSPTEVGY